MMSTEQSTREREGEKNENEGEKEQESKRERERAKCDIKSICLFWDVADGTLGVPETGNNRFFPSEPTSTKQIDIKYVDQKSDPRELQN
jgi:hypothetical protein